MAAIAQLKGLVQGFDATGTKKPISMAKVKLLQSKSGVLTKEDGTFELVLPKSLPDTLIISALGYISDSIPVNKNDRFIALDITLFSEKILPEVIIEYRKKSHGISKMKTLHVEELTSAELRKAACCNLSESFETNASVDVNITDAVSGAKKIRMMGLDGVYTQIQLENIPYLRGLESSFGLNSLPGSWIESIQITKGTGTVINGYESMAGLVNLELKKPTETAMPNDPPKITETKITEKTPLEKPKSIKPVSTPTERKKSVPVAKKDQSNFDYDCDELIEKEKKRRAKAKERAKLPKKSPLTKNKEKIDRVLEDIETRSDKGKLTKDELMKLIAECKALLKTLETTLSKMK
jgi:hypothetical protein